MKVREFRFAPLALALWGAMQVQAAGIGELTLNSRIGQPFRGEIRLISNAGEPLRASCFELGPSRENGGDIPTLSRARTSLRTKNGQTVLEITTSEPVFEPIIAFSLNAKCDIGLSREFTVLLPAPVELPVVTQAATSGGDVSAPTVARSPARARAPAETLGEWAAVEGESLQSIADALYPGDRRAQQRFINAATDANPELFGSGRGAASRSLAAGTRLKVPNLKSLAVAAPPPTARAGTVAPAERKPASATTPKTVAPAIGMQPKIAEPASEDRLKIGATPVDTGTQGGAGKTPAQTREQKLIMDLEDQVAAHQALLDKISKLEAYAERLKNELAQVEVGITAGANADAVPAQAAPTTMPRTPVEDAKPSGPTVAEPPPQPSPIESFLPGREWLIGLLSGGAVLGMLVFLVLRRRSGSSTPQHENPTLPLPGAGQGTADELPAAAGALMTPESSAAPGIPSNILPFAPHEDDSTIDVAEHESAMELADIMLSFGRLKGAAQTLADYVESNPKQSVAPWLKLLEIYRQAGMRREFETTARRMHQTFNVDIITWDDIGKDAGPNSLEDFAHISERMIATWGTADCLEYLYRLLQDNRSGSRAGFPLAVLDELLLLISVLEYHKSAARLDKLGRAA